LGSKRRRHGGLGLSSVLRQRKEDGSNIYIWRIYIILKVKYHLIRSRYLFGRIATTNFVATSLVIALRFFSYFNMKKFATLTLYCPKYQ